MRKPRSKKTPYQTTTDSSLSPEALSKLNMGSGQSGEPWWLAALGPAGLLNANATNKAREAFERLESNSRAKGTRWLVNYQTFLNREVQSLSPGGYAEQQSDQTETASSMRLNLCDSTVSTVLAHTSRAQPRPAFLLDRTPSELSEIVRAASDYIVGLYDVQQWRQKTTYVTLDALIFGAGVRRVRWRPTGKGTEATIEVERVRPWTLFYDVREVQTGGLPRTLYHTSIEDRASLAALYPAAVDAISRAPAEDSPTRFAEQTRGQVNDTVRILETWHLPSSEGADDGVYMVALADTEAPALEIRPWRSSRYPFSSLMWQINPMGWVKEAISLVDRARPYHVRANTLARRIDDGFDLAPHLLILDENANFDEGQITNERFKVIKSSLGSKAATLLSPAPVGQGYLQYLEKVVSDCYDFTGVSQSAATASKEPGITSGRALQHMSDEASVRFKDWSDRYGQHFEDLCFATVVTARDAQACGYRVGDVDWSALGVENPQFDVRCTVVSNAPRRLENQIDLASQLIKSPELGLPPQYALSLMTDLPDTGGAIKLWSSLERAVETDVSEIIAGGAAAEHLLDDNDDAEYAFQYARRVYADKRRQNPPPPAEVLEQLAIYVEAAKAKRPPAPPAGLPPGPTGPQGAQ